MSDDTISWRDLLFETAARLGSDAEAKWVCQEASGRDALDWIGGLDDPAGSRAVARLDAMVARRMAGEPIQYVLGSWSFRGLDLMVDRRVLIPRPETEQVVGWALERLRSMQPPLTVVDLGVGSGAIALAIASELPRRWGVTVWGVERSVEAMEVARANLSGIASWAATRVRLVEGSWYEPLDPALAGNVDLIVSNPPYIGDDETIDASVSEHEPVQALRAGPDGLRDLRAVIGDAPTWLSDRGVVVVEHGAGQGAATRRLAREAGLAVATTRKDLAGLDRALIASVAAPIPTDPTSVR